MQPSIQAKGKLGLGHFAFTSVAVTLYTPETIFKLEKQKGGQSLCELFLKI